MNSDGTPAAYDRSFQEGESVVYSCNRPGYALQGSSLLTCLPGGTWSASRPRCVRPSAGQNMCRNPGTISNGQRLNTDGSPSVGTQRYNSGQSVVYTCYSGYALEGSSILTCLPSGQWSSARPYCRLISSPPTTTSTESPRSDLVFCPDPGTDPNGEREIPVSVDRRTNTFPQGS
ncbi:CUB and sushi domain-containing protein 3, partial [Stegodyphus mimosarum]